MRIAYLDCFSGISGDMLLGALLDCGFPEEDLRQIIATLGLEGLNLTVAENRDNPMRSIRVEIDAGPAQPARTIQDIEELLTNADLPQKVRADSLAIFRALAAAEAAIHGCPPEEIHFHEVGAADALIDVVGAAAGLYYLGIDRVLCSPLPMPGGWVTCSHGDLPLPAPAVCELLRDVPVFGEELRQELVTPTGAAIVKVLAADFGSMPPMRLKTAGYGSGGNRRKDGRPNLLRLIIGERFTPRESQTVTVIETALDDWNPETWPHVAEQLLNRGALDVLLIPVQMKKGRPGFLVRVICDPAGDHDLQQILLTETSAIGLRYHTERRMTLPRRPVTVQTRWGPVTAKLIDAPHGPVVAPEFEECRRLAKEEKQPLREVYAEIYRSSSDLRKS